MTVMPYGWEGNRRFSVAMATHHTLDWFTHIAVHVRARGLKERDEHLAYTPLGMAHSTFYT